MMHIKTTIQAVFSGFKAKKAEGPVRPYNLNDDLPTRRLSLRICLFLVGVLLIPIVFVQSASINFTQGDWNIQNPSSIATEPFTGWTEFALKEIGVIGGSDIRLESVDYVLTQTSDDGSTDTCAATGCSAGGGFDGGTFVNTAVTGTGSAAYVHLATTPIFTDWSERRLGGFGSIPGNARHVYVSGNTLYMGDGNDGGLRIFDVTDPANPTLSGTLDTAGAARAVYVVGNIAYLADSTAGLQIIDVSTPTAPNILSTYDTTSARDVTVVGSHAYVADNTVGLKIIDISAPSNPSLAASHTTSGPARGVVVDGNFAYVAAFTSGIDIFNVTSPDTPVLVKTFVTTSDVTDIAIVGTKAYAAVNQDGLAVLDISNPIAPTLVGTYDTPDDAVQLTVAGNHVYLADTDGGLQILDITAPSAPTLTAMYHGGGPVMDVAIAGNIAYIADFEYGLEVVNVTLPGNDPALVGVDASVINGSDITVVGNFAYVTDSIGLNIFDIRTPSVILPTGPVFSTPGLANSIAVANNFAYIADNNFGLQIVDVSTLGTPNIAGTYDTPGLAMGVTIVGNIAYVADDASGLQIIDVTTPLTPTLVGTFNTSGLAKSVAVVGNTAYVADDTSGLQVIDITTPATPTLIGTFNTSDKAQHVVVDGNRAYVADSFSGLQILDITTPPTPTLIGSYGDTGFPSGNAKKIDVIGDYVYMADSENGLQILNISDPVAPAFASMYDPAGLVKSVDVVGNYAFIVNDALGLQVIRLTDYLPSGTFESDVLDLGGAQDVTLVRWNPTNPFPTTNLTMEMQAGTTLLPDCPGACTGWSNWTSVLNDVDTVTTFDNNRYFKYRATFASPTNSQLSSRLNELSLNFSNFPVGAGVVSSIFDTGDDNNFIKSLSWFEDLKGQDVRMQIATSGNGVNWNYCGAGACSTTDWLDWESGAINYYTASGADVPNLESRDAADDRYFKYKVWLKSDGVETPRADDINVEYDSASLGVFAPDGISTTFVPTVGTTFNMVVKVKDSSGANVPAHDGGISTTLKIKSTVPLQNLGGCSSTFTDINNTEFSVTSVSYDGTGQITVPIILCNALPAGFTISAREIAGGSLISDSDLTITSINIDSGSLGLIFSVQPPITTLTSLAFDPSPVVKIQDQYGNVDVSDSTTAITLTAFLDNGCSTSAGPGTFNSTSAGTASGVATFTNVNYDQPETIYIKADDGASGFPHICSNAVLISGSGYVVQVDPVYDATNDDIVVSSSLLRAGALITDNANMTLTRLEVLDNGGASLSGDLSSTSTVIDLVNSIFHTTWDSPGALVANVSYSIVAEITYQGIVYGGLRSFNINELGIIKDNLDNVNATLDNIDTNITATDTKAAEVITGVATLDARITANEVSQTAFRSQNLASLTQLNSNIGTILEDTSLTIPAFLTAKISSELARGEISEIITTQATIKSGATLPFRFRTANGLVPKVTVFDPAEKVLLNNVAMKEVGGTGIYELDVDFKSAWGLGSFMIRVEEAIKASVDNIVLNVTAPTPTDSSTGSSTTSAITLDTLFSRMNNVNSNVDSLLSKINTVKDNTSKVNAEINDLLDSVDDEEPEAESGNKSQKLGTYLDSVNSIIGSRGSASDYRTILGKLNGIENTLTTMGTSSGAALNFNDAAKLKAEKIRKFITVVMREYKEEGAIADPEEKATILEEYLTELKDTVNTIPSSVSTDGIVSSVEYTLNELNEVTSEHEVLSEIVPMIEENLEITEVKQAEDLTPADMSEMRNDVSGLKSLMLGIRGLLDQKVNKPIVHGWLEGNE